MKKNGVFKCTFLLCFVLSKEKLYLQKGCNVLDKHFNTLLCKDHILELCIFRGPNVPIELLVAPNLFQTFQWHLGFGILGFFSILAILAMLLDKSLGLVHPPLVDTSLVFRLSTNPNIVVLLERGSKMAVQIDRRLPTTAALHVIQDGLDDLRGHPEDWHLDAQVKQG